VLREVTAGTSASRLLFTPTGPAAAKCSMTGSLGCESSKMRSKPRAQQAGILRSLAAVSVLPLVLERNQATRAPLDCPRALAQDPNRSRDLNSAGLTAA